MLPGIAGCVGALGGGAPSGPTATAHRYWRIYVGSDSSGGIGALTAIAEMEMRESVGGSDATGSGTASASSTFSGFSAGGAFANDANTTEWASNNIGLPAWLAYDFGSGVTKAIVEVGITSRLGGNVGQGPGAFKIQSSDDNWTTYNEEWWVAYPGGSNGHGYSGAGAMKTFTKPVTDQSPSASRHRYWQISITGANGGAFVGADEVEFRTIANGQSECFNGTASSQSNFGGLPPSQAFDRVTGQDWASNNVGFPEYLRYDLGSGVSASITEISILPRSTAAGSQSPTGFDVQYSDDGSSFSTLWSVSGITGWTAGVWKTFTKP